MEECFAPDVRLLGADGAGTPHTLQFTADRVTLRQGQGRTPPKHSVSSPTSTPSSVSVSVSVSVCVCVYDVKTQKVDEAAQLSINYRTALLERTITNHL